METTNRRNIAILSFAMVVVMLGFGMVIPIFPFFVTKLGASGDELGLLIATAALTQLLFSPFWGDVADRVGRKPVLILGMAGSGLTVLFFGLATELWMLFAARALSGVLSSATFPAAMAYISDSTSEEDRGGGMGIVAAAAGLGIILGPGLGGWLAGDSLSTPFFVAAALSAVSLGLLFLLPESFSPEARRQHAAREKPRSGLGEMWQAVRSPIGVLLFVAFLMGFGLTGFQGIFGLFAMRKFGYGPQEVGLLMMVVGFVGTLAQGLLTGRLTKRWGEAIVIRVCLLASSVGFVLLVLAGDYVTLLLATGFFVLAKSFLRPSVAALISKQATVGHGMAMGLNNSFMSLGQIVGPIWAGYVFDIGYDYPYLSTAAIAFLGFLVALAWIRPETSPGSSSQAAAPALGTGSET